MSNIISLAFNELGVLSTMEVTSKPNPISTSKEVIIQLNLRVCNPKPSPRTGKLPVSASHHIAESENPAFRLRMEQARAALAQETNHLVPESLAQLRLSKGFSQVSLAKMLGTSQSHIAKIENGDIQIYWHTAVKLADALAVPLDSLRGLIKMDQEGSVTVTKEIL